jgi:hypothetical protein
MDARSDGDGISVWGEDYGEDRYDRQESLQKRSSRMLNQVSGVRLLRAVFGLSGLMDELVAQKPREQIRAFIERYGGRAVSMTDMNALHEKDKSLGMTDKDSTQKECHKS